MYVTSNFHVPPSIRLARLNSVEKSFLCDVAGIDVVESENERLKQRLKDLTAEHSVVTSQQQKERASREANSFDLRMQLEQILRQAIKSQNDLYVTQSVSLHFKDATMLLYSPAIRLIIYSF